MEKSLNKSVDYLKNYIQQNPDKDDMGVRGLLTQYLSEKPIDLVEAIKLSYPLSRIVEYSRWDLLGKIILGKKRVDSALLLKEALFDVDNINSLSEEEKYGLTHYIWSYFIEVKREGKRIDKRAYQILKRIAKSEFKDGFEEKQTDLFTECIYFMVMYSPNPFSNPYLKVNTLYVLSSVNEDGSYGEISDNAEYLPHQTALSINIIKKMLYSK